MYVSYPSFFKAPFVQPEHFFSPHFFPLVELRYLYNYFTLQSPSVFSLAKSLQLILVNSATYRLFTNPYLQSSELSVGCARNTWFPRAMSSSPTARCLKINCDHCDNAFVVIFLKTMYSKTIISFGFCDIRNNQCLGQCYQPQPSASADNTYLDLDYSGYHKTLIQ